MNIRLLILSVILLPLYISVFGQKKKVTITADISGYTGKLSVSNHAEWQGDDTLVPAVIQGKMSSSHIMGAEYLLFSNPGDAMNPNNDSIPGRRLKVWRSKAKIDNKIYTWTFETDKPCEVTNTSLLGGSYLILPGDSIHVSYDQGKYFFSGKGSAKFQVSYDANTAKESVVFPDKRGHQLDIERFLKRDKYLNEQVDKIMPILESNKSKISQLEYDWIKGKILGSIEYYRWLYFFLISKPAKDKDQILPYSTGDLNKVWDTTMYRPEALWLRSADVQNIPSVGNCSYIESFILTELLRKFNFQPKDTIYKQVVKKLTYQQLKSKYTGLFRERILCHFIEEEIIQEMGSYNWFAQSILKDYYNIPGFPAYKNWMKQWEKEHQYLSNGKDDVGNGGVPLFELQDQNGNRYSKNHFKGKLTIVNFWYSDCDPCKQTAKYLSKLQQKYKNDPNVVFLHVSVDTDKKRWEKSVREGEYVPTAGLQLFTGGLGKRHEIVKDFDVNEFPTIRIFDHNGRIVIDEADPFVNTFSEKHLDAITGNQLSKFKDGPYVFFENGKTKAYAINGTNVENLKSVARFASSTDKYDTQFSFSLQKQIAVPPAVYLAPSKMLVLSDIEGNFGGFRKLLQANNVIDENFNWTFGSGHLVFAGDMFDRGEQVTECLWLIYSLEEKSKVAHGLVHFILGNHEIMNLNGDDRYVKNKYKNTYKLLGKTLAEVYGENSELGRWLRTKNIVEKIGDNLFCHGGISRELNQTSVTIEEINRLARPHYAEKRKDYGNESINTIMSSSVGPFWYRGYYESKPAESMVDSTLQKFNVNHIVTGHTIIADTISVRFGGKVINTDTHHAAGKSEALLIENDRYYRVSHTGDKILLFKENNDLLNGKQARNH